ncbi:MAG: selenocysteine-specific translation elongation factor [Desulfotomaculaceae bacterium]|nr:selenocysteine-specific translation elongation factor [Desulfotomaculaceae bacterium]
MKRLIIGTAGHASHGKTALIKAMTGVDTDRLKEEKERGISIELGFTALKLPGGLTCGIVDVPGNERFIKNMLAGIGGIDLVLLVIAADEGVMPQTREHLDIIHLLQIKKGIVVLTKTDLVDVEWLDFISKEVRGFLKDSVLEDAPVATVSAMTGAGIGNLLELLDRVAEDTPAKTTAGPPRLPVDRVFSLMGFGTVVTGTLIAGEIRVGDAVEVQPQGLISRVRSLQSHGKTVRFAKAGQRVATNLAGLEVEQISRGSAVAGVNSLTPSNRLDVHLLLLKGVAKPLKNRARVRFHLGAGEKLGRIVLLDREELAPGAMAYAQIELESKTTAIRGDRFVIRSYSPMRTIGGGAVIDPAPNRRHKRFRSEVLQALETWARGTPAEILEQYLRGNTRLPELADVAAKTGLGVSETKELVQHLARQGKIKLVPGDGKVYLILTEVYRRMAGELQQMLETYHHQFPLREGYPKQELHYRKFPALNNKIFQLLLAAMEKDQLLRCTAQAVASPSIASGPSPEMNLIIEQIRKKLAEASFRPPKWSQLTAAAGLSKNVSSELLQYLLRTGELKKIADNLYLLDETITMANREVAGFLHQKGEMTVGDLRDLLQTSRKYALPLLQYFDRERITRPLPDNRRLPGKALG